MDYIKQYSDRELQEMRDICKEINISPFTDRETQMLRAICKIALIEINRELDEGIKYENQL